MSIPAPPAAPERQIAFDMVKRALPVAPVLLIAAAIGWGLHGALSAGYAIALVLINFVLAASLLAWAGPKGPAAIMSAAMGGFALRMGLLLAAVFPVRHQQWFEMIPFGITLLVTHGGLLAWESRHVSASLAFPGLKPKPKPKTETSTTPSIGA